MKDYKLSEIKAICENVRVDVAHNEGFREAQTINRHITRCACCGEEVESEVAYCVCEKCRQVIRRIRRKQNGTALNNR